MCRSPAAIRCVAPAVPVAHKADEDSVVVQTSSASRPRRPLLLHRASTSTTRSPLAVRRPISAPRVPQQHVRTVISREDLDCVRVALERELAVDRPPLSDAELVENVASNVSRHHPLVVGIVLSKLREQNAAFFAGYDARKRGGGRGETSTTTISTLEPASAAASASESDVLFRATNSFVSSEDDSDERCNNNGNSSNNNSTRDEASSDDDDAVVPLRN